MIIEKVIRRTRDGGSCAECNGDYVGWPLSPRGYRVLARIEPGLVEPVNLCPSCYEKLDEEPEPPDPIR